MRIRYIVFIATFFASVARADIVECNGVVTNRGCEEGPGERLFEETTKAPQQAPTEPETTIAELLNRLDSVRYSLKRNHGLVFDILPIKAQCEESSVRDCAKIVHDAQVEMNQLAAKRSEKATPVVTPAPTKEPSTVVTINQPPIILVRPRRIGPGIDPIRIPTIPSLRSPATPPSTRMKTATPN